MRKLLIGFFILFLFLLSNLLLLQNVFASHIPAPTGLVNDFAGVLTSDQKNTLEEYLLNYQKKTDNEIGVALVENLNGGEIDDFTVRAFEEWKLGEKGKDNGILILAAIEDHKIRIEVGYGLEPYLTDSQAGRIIREDISPKFKEGNYFEGLQSGIYAIVERLPADGTTSPTAPVRDNPLLGTFIKLIIEIGLYLIFPLLGLVAYFFSYMGRTKSIKAGGIAGAIIGVLIGIIFSLLLAGILGLVLGGLGLLLDWILSRNYQERSAAHKPTDWWRSGGGFFMGGRRGGGGFGGFGGGSSGGGGASGDW